MEELLRSGALGREKLRDSWAFRFSQLFRSPFKSRGKTGDTWQMFAGFQASLFGLSFCLFFKPEYSKVCFEPPVLVIGLTILVSILQNQ